MLEGGGRTPILSPMELADVGYKIVAYPLSLMGVSIRAMQVTQFCCVCLYVCMHVSCLYVSMCVCYKNHLLRTNLYVIQQKYGINISLATSWLYLHANL